MGSHQGWTRLELRNRCQYGAGKGRELLVFLRHVQAVRDAAIVSVNGQSRISCGWWLVGSGDGGR
jgi:hypothetical protein